MPDHLLSVETIGSLVSLTALETVLGIDNIIFLSILVNKLPARQQASGRRLGLLLALGMRICLLLTLSYLAGLTAPLFHIASRGISGRDLVLLLGGAFLVVKSAFELRTSVAGEEQDEPTSRDGRGKGLIMTLAQIVLMDIVFSLDSVITAVGLAQFVAVMITAMVLSMLVMLVFAKAIGDFVSRHPGMKVLALMFLVLVGGVLVAEGIGQAVPRGYIYFAMAFSFLVELLNMRMRRNVAMAGLAAPHPGDEDD